MTPMALNNIQTNEAAYAALGAQSGLQETGRESKTPPSPRPSSWLLGKGVKAWAPQLCLGNVGNPHLSVRGVCRAEQLQKAEGLQACVLCD